VSEGQVMTGDGESVQVRLRHSHEVGSMLEFCRDVVRFFSDCIDALRDDEVAAEPFDARQRRWLEYLRN
jgi:hypothetical protein